MAPWIDLAGWTLLHFLWQAAIVWVLTAAALRAATTPQMRYAAGCCGLAVLLALPVVTAWSLSSSARAVAATRVQRLERAADVFGSSQPHAAAPPAGEPASGLGSRLASPGNPNAGPPSRDADVMLPAAVVTIWLAGLAVMLMRLAGGCWQVRRLRHAVLRGHPSRWQDAAVRIARRLGLRRPILVVDSDRIDAPAVVG